MAAAAAYPNQQFRDIPPKALVVSLFRMFTGCEFENGARWEFWKMVPTPVVGTFRSFIRSSHQKIIGRLLEELAEAADSATTLLPDTVNPVPFLRQILRPHGYNIVLLGGGGGGWQLVQKGVPVPRCRYSLPLPLPVPADADE